jgi:hypothetical protein
VRFAGHELTGLEAWALARRLIEALSPKRKDIATTHWRDEIDHTLQRMYEGCEVEVADSLVVAFGMIMREILTDQST